MEFQQALRSKRQAEPIVKDIQRCARQINKEIRIMEVCGTHTVCLRKAGIHSLLPENVSMVSGPGCPVCVTPTGYIDNAIAIAVEHRALVATFGDMLKVPGSKKTTLSHYSASDDLRIVYSPNEISQIQQTTGRPVVFLGIGFETTVPAIAAVFLRAAQAECRNLYLYTAFKTVPAALEALLAMPGNAIDGFLLPGHVSVVIGPHAYNGLQRPSGVPGVIAGFEPLDMLWGISRLLALIRDGKRCVVNAYPRAVRPEGNPRARAFVEALLEPCDELWRGLGIVPASGLRLRHKYRHFDAAAVLGLPPAENHEPSGCLCAQVLIGGANPVDCPLFGKRCTPGEPIGPCMVSSEGSCGAHYRYGD